MKGIITSACYARIVSINGAIKKDIMEGFIVLADNGVKQVCM